MLEIIGGLLLLFAGWFILFGLIAIITKSQQIAFKQFLFGLVLLGVALYLMSGAPHIVRALRRLR